MRIMLRARVVRVVEVEELLAVPPVLTGRRGMRVGEDAGDALLLLVVLGEPGLGWNLVRISVVLVVLGGARWGVKAGGDSQGRVKGRRARWVTVRMMALKSRPVAQAKMSVLRCTVGVPPPRR